MDRPLAEREERAEGPSGLAARAPSVRVGFETARLRLAEIHDEGREARSTAYRIACKHSATTLQVERVSIWLLSEDGERLDCVLLHRLTGDSTSSGEQIHRRSCPAYFAAIRSRRVVVASDALTDARTRELAEYLQAADVGALLDAPIYRDGRVIGVVCHEHVGGSRAWTEKEAGFASAVADMLTILIQQAERAELRAAIDAQRQLQAQHDKMQALAKLGRIVIHDLGNVLTIASLRAGALDSEPDLRAASENMQQVLHYGNELLRQLRDFCEERAPTSTVEVVSVLAAMEPVLRALLGKNIELCLSSKAEPSELAIARVEFEQLVLNLCMNAKDAVRESGRVAVSMTKVDDQVVLEVEDDGPGMDEATQSRLFEPFYTTKPGHSGIGLSAVYGIVERARGSVEVRSAPGRGTTFRVRLPLPRGGSDPLEPPWGF